MRSVCCFNERSLRRASFAPSRVMRADGGCIPRRARPVGSAQGSAVRRSRQAPLRDHDATPLAQRYFDQGLRLYYPDHPGANHFYIHAVEAVQPERALAAAERLAALMPGAGHIVHMPGHIYVRVGRYLDAIQANEHAIHADETYIRDHARAAACIRPATIRTTTTSWRSRRA